MTSRLQFTNTPYRPNELALGLCYYLCGIA